MKIWKYIINSVRLRSLTQHFVQSLAQKLIISTPLTACLPLFCICNFVFWTKTQKVASEKVRRENNDELCRSSLFLIVHQN